MPQHGATASKDPRSGGGRDASDPRGRRRYSPLATFSDQRFSTGMKTRAAAPTSIDSRWLAASWKLAGTVPGNDARAVNQLRRESIEK